MVLSHHELMNLSKGDGGGRSVQIKEKMISRTSVVKLQARKRYLTIFGIGLQAYIGSWGQPLITSVVSSIMDTGSKGYPLFRFGTGREGGWETPTSRRTSSRPPIYVLPSNTGTQRVYPGSGRPEAKSPTCNSPELVP